MAQKIGEAMQQVREHLVKSPSTRFTRTQTHILTSELPEHWRSNKSLQIPFTVLSLLPVPDGTRITVHAGNDEAPCGEVRNAQTEFKRQCAKFSDLRFVGKSGRGRTFHLTLVIHTDPLQVVVVARSIKVTSDGRRPGRQSILRERKEKEEPRESQRMIRKRIPLKRPSHPPSQSPSLRAHSATSSESSYTDLQGKKKFAWDTPPSSAGATAMGVIGWPTAIGGGFPSSMPFLSSPPHSSPHPYPPPIPNLFPQLYSMQLQALLATRGTPFLTPPSLTSSPLQMGMGSRGMLPSSALSFAPPHRPSIPSIPSLSISPSTPLKHFTTQEETESTPTTSRKRKKSFEMIGEGEGEEEGGDGRDSPNSPDSPDSPSSKRPPSPSPKTTNESSSALWRPFEATR